jgi:glycosyltransferase involved in cell wall biosynthesis
VKIAFVLGTSAGGTGRHVKMLAAGCAALGRPVQVFGPAQTDRAFGFTSGDVSPGGAAVRFAAVDIADRPRLLPDLRAIVRLHRLIEAGQPGVVHAHGLRAGALTALALAWSRRRNGAPAALVVTVHNAPPARGVVGAIYRVLELIVARQADSVLCVSPDLEQRMRAVGARRVVRAVVPAPVVSLSPRTGVSAETRAASGAVPRGPVVLAVGRLAAQKGFGTLLEAAARWRGIRPEPVLVIAGEGPLEAELKGQAAALGLTVEFAGPRADVPALLAAAAVFVLPSAWEGQPLVLQEALRAGVPIVATRVGGTPDLVGEDAAVLVPPGDPERLASAVLAVLTDRALAARLCAAAAARARGLPGEADAVAAALAEYDLVTGGGGAVRA